MADALDILKTRARKVGSLYRFDAAESALGVDTLAEPSVDLNAMSASVVISTPTVDRSGDSILAEGFDLTNYAKNPLVLWEHGFSTQGTVPVGKSEDAHGKLTILIERGLVKATCFFSQVDAFARQVFGLVAERIIRGASVRILPQDYVQQPGGLLVRTCDLEEWSWVAIPCNPEAVAKTVRDKKIPGSKEVLAPVLLKSLSRFVPPGPLKGIGWEPPKEAHMPKKPIAKTAPEEEKPEDEKVEETKTETDEGVPDEPEIKAKKPKPGHAHLTGMADWLKAGIEAVGADLENQENETVRAFSTGALETLRGLCAECEGKRSEAYGDGEAEGDDEPDSEMKSAAAFSAKGNTRLRLRAAGIRLDGVLKASNLPKEHRDAIVGARDALLKTADEAKKIADKSAGGDKEAAQKALDALSEKFKSLSTDLTNLLPRGKR